jgi:hypothetical protein
MTKKLMHLLHLSFLVAVLLLASAEISHATDIRGQVTARYKVTGHQAPLYDARVDLYVKDGDKWKLVSTWITGENGMYYMKNIQPGKYFLQINRRWNYQITVLPKRRQDIPRIIVMF